VRVRPASLRFLVLTVARAVGALALFASAAAFVIAVVLYRDGVSGSDVLGLLLAIAPLVVLWLLWAALRELAELPDRLRRFPETARERRVDLERVASDLRKPGRLVRLPGTLWRMRVLAGTARDLVTPHAPLLPFLSPMFLTAAAIAAFAAVAEIGIALLLLIGAVL
jgi:membrane protein implicated in regulation of membrane protease activity